MFSIKIRFQFISHYYSNTWKQIKFAYDIDEISINCGRAVVTKLRKRFFKCCLILNILKKMDVLNECFY